MLYIASALTPTPISHSLKVDGLTAPDATSLVVAKPDRIQVWDVTASGLGLTAELPVWGTVVGLAATCIEGARPHLLVLVSPPHAFLHLVGFEDGALVITASQALRPPMPLLRLQEFFTGVVCNGTRAVVSLWTGILTRLEMELEKVKDMKRRQGERGERRLVFRSSMNLNIREHNLLHLAFLPGEPEVLLFLWMSEYNKISVQARAQPRGDDREWDGLAPPVDVVNPMDEPMSKKDVDFEWTPFSCPAGRNLLPVGAGPGDTRLFLVIGDEHAVMYALSPSSGDKHRSPRASAARRSPQVETGGIGKKRKSSASGRSVATDASEYQLRPVWRVRQGFGTVLASTLIENHTTGGSVLLGDECGRLTAIGWEFDGDNVTVGKIDLNAVSPPTSLTYIDNGYVFVSSACGDSLLISLDMAPEDAALASLSKGKGKGRVTADVGAWGITLLPDAHRKATVQERWMNIAPVKDFAVVEEDDGRVSHLVVASGAGNSNSLRIVRSGAGLEDLLAVEGITGVERMWSLPASEPTILLSFGSSTAILCLEPVKFVPAAEAVTSAPTLAAGLVGSGDVLAQVTPTGAFLWSDLVAGTTVASFPAGENEIVAASVKRDSIITAFRDGTVTAWTATLEPLASTKLAREAATVDIDASGTLAAVADWTGSVDVLRLPDFEPVLSIQESSYVWSLLLTSTVLHAGLSDGTYVGHDLDTKARTQSSLGSRPLALAPVTVSSGDDTVFAAGVSERLSLLFESRGHTEVSTSGMKGVLAATSITTPGLGTCLVLATSDGIRFARLTSLKKLQVQTLDMDFASPTRLAVLPDRTIAVGTVTQTLSPETGDIIQSSSVELRDATTLEFIGSHDLDELEAVTSVNTLRIKGEDFIAVGKAIFESSEEAVEARLDEMSSFIHAHEGGLTIYEHKGGKFEELQFMLTEAPPLECVAIHDFIAFAHGSKVEIWRFTDDDEVETADNLGFTKLDSCSFAFEAHFLAVSRGPEGDRLVVGDAMRSILVLDVDKKDGSITRNQRDMSSHAVRALAAVRDDGPGAIVTDDHANVLTFRLKDEIEQAATFGLHEEIARLRPGALANTAPDMLRPDLVFATSNGRLGIIGELGAGATRTLDDLQRNLNRIQKGPGDLTWKEFRRGGSLAIPRETLGFVDGDYVQSFLHLGLDDAAAALEGQSAPERVQRLGERGREAASRADVVRVLEAVAGMH